MSNTPIFMLSSDTKPTTAEPGRELVESDTGKRFSFVNGVWELRLSGTQVKDASLQPLGVAQYTTGLTSVVRPSVDAPDLGVGVVPAGARMALLRVLGSGASIRFADSGSAPTAALGFKLAAADGPFWYIGDLDALRIIESDPTVSEVTLAYYA